MKIEDLQETAALAHLNFKDEELKAAFPAFEQILGFFAAMQDADNDTEAFSTSIARLSRQTHTADPDFFRRDTLAAGLSGGQNEALLDNAGERDGRFILIPNVL